MRSCFSSFFTLMPFQYRKVNKVTRKKGILVSIKSYHDLFGNSPKTDHKIQTGHAPAREHDLFESYDLL